MQNIYYIDSNFIKENSSQYSLSIRYATDGLSFCVHDANNKLLTFFFQPFDLESRDAVIAKVKTILVDEPLLNLSYRKVYLISCNKEKVLVPAEFFHQDHLSDMFRLCLQLDKNDILLYRKIEAAESYIVEAFPRSFVTFLSARFQSLCVVNSAYPFIAQSLSNIVFNTPHLFIDIHDRYFDLLLTHSNDILLFNSFTYGSVNDIIYHALNCLQQCDANKDKLQTTISGNLVNDPKLVNMLNQYIPNISILNYAPLSQLVKKHDLNNSSFIHLLNIHKCE